MAKSLLKDFFAKASLEAKAEEQKKEEEILAEPEETGVDSMEYALQSVAEAGDDVEEVEDDIEELEEIKEGLEAIVSSLEASLEAGGLDPVSAQFTHHAVAAYTDRLALDVDQIIPSLEAFGGDTGRIASTQVSVEGVKETIAAVWKAIKTAIEYAIKITADFFAKVFGGVGKVEKRLKVLEAKLKTMQASGQTKNKIKIANADTLKVDSKIDSGAIIAGLKAFGEVGTVVNGVYLDAITKVISDAPTKLAKMVEAADAAAAGEILKLYVDEVTAATAKLESIKGKILSGDKHVIVAEGSAPKIESVDGSKSLNEIEVVALSVQEMNSVIAQLKEMVAIISSKKVNIEKVLSARAKSVKNIDTAVSKEAKNDGKALTKALNVAQKDLTALISAFSSLTFSVIRSAITLLETSIKAYDAAPAKEAGKATTEAKAEDAGEEEEKGIEEVGKEEEDK